MPESTTTLIRKLREDHDLKQDVVAKHLGVAQQTYSSYEQGKFSISLDNLVKLAQLYDVSADYLLGLTTLEKPAEKTMTELTTHYARSKTLGAVNSAMLDLTPESRRLLLDFLDFLSLKQKDTSKKRKPKR